MSVQKTKNLWPAIRANLRLAAKASVAMGFPGESPKSKKPHPSEDERPMTNVEVALANEFGSAPGVKPAVPARPFVKTAMDRHGAELQKGAADQLAMISRGEQTTHRALSDLGKIGADKIQATIVDSKSWAVPNAPYTVAKKRSSTPLIDTGAMRQAVTYKVRMGGSK